MTAQDANLIARPQPDPIQALREIAPKNRPWLCTSISGVSRFQIARGCGSYWTHSRHMEDRIAFACEGLDGTAIHLKTGTVHLQSADGTITEVTRAEWDV